MARPKKDREYTRDITVRVRLTFDENKSLTEAADNAGLTISDFVRVKTIGTKPRTIKATPERAELIRHLSDLGKLGSNMNQIARALNRRIDSDSLTGIDIKQIEFAAAEVKAIRDRIRELLEW